MKRHVSWELVNLPEPATPTVAAPAPMYLHAVSMSFNVGVVANVRFCMGNTPTSDESTTIQGLDAQSSLACNCLGHFRNCILGMATITDMYLFCCAHSLCQLSLEW